MTARGRYATPAAFRRALTDRIKSMSMSASAKWTVPQLQQQVAYDRLLERLYLVDDSWIVKGATALLARDLGVRGSLDIDLYRFGGREVAEADLRRAADLDIGDWFQFEVGLANPAASGALRLPINATIGGTTWFVFHVDLVGPEIVMTGHPDDVPPLVRGAIPDVEQSGYRAYPLVDHVADKVAAMYELHGSARVPSTRYRDLVDLVAIVLGASVRAEEQRMAIVSELERRGLIIPESFGAPDRSLWERGYAVEAGRSLLNIASTLDEAVELVGSFANPLFDGTAHGIWNPNARRWTH